MSIIVQQDATINSCCYLSWRRQVAATVG